MAASVLALSQHCVLKRLSSYPLSLLLLWGAVNKQQHSISTAIEEVLFQWDYVHVVSEGIQSGIRYHSTDEYTLEDKISAFTVLCQCVRPEQYCLPLHKLLEWFLNWIPSTTLLRRSFRDKFRIYENKKRKTIEPFCTGLCPIGTFYEQELKPAEGNTTPHDVIDIIQFPLLELVYNIHIWRHDAIYSIIQCNKNHSSLLSRKECWLNTCNVESSGMDHVKWYILAQLEKLKVETKIYQPMSKRKPRPEKAINRIYLSITSQRERSVSRRVLYDRYVEQVFAEPRHPASDTFKKEKVESIALTLAQSLFGNIYKGQACTTCAKRYRSPIADDIWGAECLFRRKFDAQERNRLRKIPFRRFCGGLELLMDRFTEFYDEEYISIGFYKLAMDFICPFRFPLHRDQFRLYVKLISHVVAGMSRSSNPKRLQILLQKKLDPKNSSCCDMWTANIVERLVRTADSPFLGKFLALSKKIDVDCICLGRIILQVMESRRELMFETLMSLEPDATFLSIAQALVTLQGEDG